MSARRPEAWLRGPIEGIDPWLQPVAHALVQAGEELELAVAGLGVDELWARPGDVASIGFHLRHVAGSIDRLLTYAEGGQLDEAQREALRREGDPEEPPAEAEALVRAAVAATQRVLEVLRRTDPATLLDPREVGRARLPSTKLGLLFHIAEHTARHVGQIVTTAKLVRSRAGIASESG